MKVPSDTATENLDLDFLIPLVSDEDPEVRGRTAVVLGQIGGTGAFRVLVDLLSDSDERVRLEAISSLGDIGSSVALEPLMPLLEEESVEIRCQTISALAKIGDPRAFASVIIRVFDSSDDVRKNAVAAIGCLSDPRALEPLLLCLSDENSEVRANSAWSLGALGLIDAVDKLIDLSDSRDIDEVRANAVTSLGAIGSKCRISDQDESHRALCQVVDVLDDSSESMRVRIAAAIAATKALDAISLMDKHLAIRLLQALMILADSDIPEDLRSTCIWCLAQVFAYCGAASDVASELSVSVSADTHDFSGGNFGTKGSYVDSFEAIEAIDLGASASDVGASGASVKGSANFTNNFSFNLLSLIDAGIVDKIMHILERALTDGGEWSIRYSLEALANIGTIKALRPEALKTVKAFAGSESAKPYHDLCEEALCRINQS